MPQPDGRVVDYVKLAAALAKRFAAVVPPTVTVRADGQAIYFHMKGPARVQMGTGAYVQDVNSGGESLESALDHTIRNALSDLQDFIQEATTDVWPVATHPDGTSRLVEPHCHVGHGRIHMSYGDVLMLDDLPLQEIITPAPRG